MSRLMEELSSFPSTASTSQEDYESISRSTSSRKLRVTLLSSEWRSTKGGLSTINRELAIQLAKHPSVEVSVYLPQCSEEDKQVAASQNVHLIEAEEMAGYDNPVDWLSSLPEDHAVDCVIGHGAVLGRQVQFIKRHCNCKWIQVVHTAPEELGMFKSYTDAISRGEKKHQAEVKLCEKADQVVAVGPKLAEAFSGYLRACRKDQDVLNLTPGIFSEFSDVKQATEERKTFSVLVFGRGDNGDFQLKGYDIAARAIAELKDEPQPYKLLFVGAPSGEEEKVKDLLLQQGIDRSQLTVRCFNESRGQLARLFCEVDLALMPSRTEGFGLAALEALSAGLPVLVSGNSGLGEALKEALIGSNCVLESEDPKDWANAIKAVRKKNRKLRLRETKLLQGEYAEMYSWQDHCNKLVERMLAISQGPNTDEQNLSKKATVICQDENPSFSGKRLHKGSKKGKRPLSPSNTPASKVPKYLGDEGGDSLVLVKLLKKEYKRRSQLRPLLWDSTIQLPIEQVYTRLKIVSRGKLAIQMEDEEKQSDKEVIILDGLDELPEQSRHHVDELLHRRILSFCFVLATTRQERGIEVRKSVVFDIHLEIKGYTESDSIAYVRRHFESIGQSPKGERLIEEIQQNTMLHALRNNPLNLLLLCVIFEAYDGQLPTSRTELYQVIVQCLLRRYCAKHSLAVPKDTTTLRKRFEKDVLALGDLAWACLLSDRESFREGELAEHEVRNKNLVARKIGLLYMEESLKRISPQHEYWFLHKTFQEYLAAAFIAHKLLRGELKVFEYTTFADLVGKYPQVFLFVSGMLGEKATVLFRQIRKKLKEKGDWDWSMCNKQVSQFFVESFSESGHAKLMAVELYQGGKDAIPSEILARGRLAIEAYRRALLEGKGYARRVPVMIIGQARTGKTSLKRSLKGELFNPNEGSTEGIETDPSYFKVSTDVWRTGKNGEEIESEPTFSFEHQAAQNIVESLRKGDRLGDPSTSGAKPSINDSKVVEQIEANSLPTERSEETSSSRIEPSLQDSKVVEKAKPYSLRTEDLSSSRTELSLHASNVSEKAQTSSSRTEQTGSDPSLQDSKDHLSVPELPENVAALVQNLLEHSQEFEDEDNIYSIIWDFGGQSVYYATHPIFLTKQAIYILACDLSLDQYQKAKAPTKKGMYENKIDTHCKKTNLDYLDFWMTSVYSLVDPNSNCQETVSPEMLPVVFLACTHADVLDKNKADPKELADKIFGTLSDKIYGDLLKDVFVVDNTKSGSNDECQGVKNLRERVLSVAKELPQIKRAIPLKWLKYEKVLRLLSEEGYRWIPIEHARQIASDECGIDDDEQFRTVLNFLHDQRILIHFSETANLEKMVILSPQWLIDIFKEVITVKRFKQTDKTVARLWRNFEKTGILDVTLLNHAWRPLSDNRETCENLISIMEKFSLLCAWPSDGTTQKYLVPSMLMSPPTDDVLKHLDCVRTPSLFVAFESGRVPAGLFSRLVLQFHRWCQEWKSEINPELFNNFAMFHILPYRAISLVFMLHSSSIEIVFHDGKDARDLNTSQFIYSQLKCLLEHTCKDFFWLKHVKYKMCVCCPVCSQEDDVKCRAHDKRGCECLHLLSESELRERPYCNRPVICGDRTITITMFEHWFAFCDSQQSSIPLTQQQSTIEGDNFGKRGSVYCRQENASVTSATDPPQVVARQITNKDLPPKSKHFDYCQIQVDILLLTVMKEDTSEDCEFLSCLEHLNPDLRKIYHPDLGYVYLGDIGEDYLKLNVAVMKCYEGSSSTGGSIVVVINAVRVLKPKAVFCVGCCSGLNDTKVSLGDVVVLKKLVTYAFSKVTENGIEELGVKVPLKPHLSKLILGVGDGWTPPLKDPGALEVKIHRGTFLSGPEVINNHKRCNALIERFPEAVAIEREGEGVFAAAHDLDIEWVVIKGISGYADGRKVKDSWRTFASFMAASLTAHILSDTIAFQAWPHYGSARKDRKCSLETDEVDAELDWDRGIIKKHKSGVN